MLSSDRLDALERLAALHAQGALSDQEFSEQKAKILDAAKADRITAPLTARDVETTAFRAALWGYDLNDVDDFMDVVQRVLLDAEGAQPSGEYLLTSAELPHVTFRTTIRGYNLHDVDEFVDRVHAALTFYEQGGY